VCSPRLERHRGCAAGFNRVVYNGLVDVIDERQGKIVEGDAVLGSIFSVLDVYDLTGAKIKGEAC